jgi:predicted dinucleotide-binding enzyme
MLVRAIDGARYVDAGPLSNARTVEAMTALLIGINIRYKIPGAGIRITGIPEESTGA